MNAQIEVRADLTLTAAGQPIARLRPLEAFGLAESLMRAGMRRVIAEETDDEFLKPGADARSPREACHR